MLISKILYFAALIATSILTLGGMVYYLLAISTIRKLKQRSKDSSLNSKPQPPITLLKPLCGIDPGLEEHLESFFLQDYPSFEILFAVRTEADPAVAVVERLKARYPQIPARLIVTGEPPYANAKVYSMEKMAEVASHTILIITDSDASVSRNYLQDMAVAFEPAEVGAVTNLYRGVSIPDFWSRLEAIGMSSEFMAGVVVAERMEGMKFTLGPSMAIRTDCLKKIGGFAAMAEYLADDFVLGKWASEAGFRVVLSTHVINHHATSTGFINSFKHRLRWNRSTRFSRPDGYLGQCFTYGLAWGLICSLVYLGVGLQWSLGILLVSLLLRAWLAYELVARLLEDRSAIWFFWLIPFQDLLSFATWVGAFFGREIVWRNERYRLLRGGRFIPVSPRRA